MMYKHCKVEVSPFYRSDLGCDLLEVIQLVWQIMDLNTGLFFPLLCRMASVYAKHEKILVQ